MSDSMASLYLGLVHHPVRNKCGAEVTTSVTNLDIHDIARSCRSFGVKQYFIITPLEAQQALVNRILNHWHQENSSVYNPDRADALAYVRVVSSIEEASKIILESEKAAPKVIVTGANFVEKMTSTSDMRKIMLLDKTPNFLLFGTGWGLSASVVDHADYRLGPILSPYALNGYNHLSVRSAVAIYLDRLRGSL